MSRTSTKSPAISPAAVALMQGSGMLRALDVFVAPTWPDNTPFLEAEQPAKIGEVLVATLHRHLIGAQIGYVFREDISHHDKTTLAKASKAGSKLGFYTGLDLCIDVNHSAWLRLSSEQRVALIDHELCHFGVEETDKGTRYVLLCHDVEEFGAIVSRWGLWKPDLREFGRVVTEQVELFGALAQPSPAAANGESKAPSGRDRAAGRDD